MFSLGEERDIGSWWTVTVSIDDDRGTGDGKRDGVGGVAGDDSDGGSNDDGTCDEVVNVQGLF